MARSLFGPRGSILLEPLPGDQPKMGRTSSPLLLVSVLSLGVLLGWNLAETRRPLVAQQQPGQGRAPSSPLEDVAPRGAGAASQAINRSQGDDALYNQLSRQYSLFEHVNQTFELVSKAVSPSVVHLVAHKVGKTDDDARVGDFEETGSGVIVRADSARGLFVLTNNHVVAGTSPNQIDVFLSDGRSFHPSKVWLDSKADIAVLKLDRTDLPAARLGNSDEASVGSWVLAIGSPFGLSHSVSQGIISGRGRHETDLERNGVENQDFLQTDAAINPGNSGGPLVNMKGEVVGINIAIISNHGGNEGVGFSIPINLARWIMDQLLSNGRVSRGAIGVKLHPGFESQKAQSLGLDRPQGALIQSVDPTSPAAQGGVKVGDVVLRFNATEVSDLNHFINLVSMAPIGQAADLVIWRDRREMTVRVQVADKDRIIAQSRPSRHLPTLATVSIKGLELVTLDASVARRMGIPEEFKGVTVTKVEPDSPMASLFRPLDVIHSIGGKDVTTTEQVIQALSAGRNAKTGELSIYRMLEGAFIPTTVQLP